MFDLESCEEVNHAKIRFPDKDVLLVSFVVISGWTGASSIDHNPVNIREWHVPFEEQSRDSFTFHNLLIIKLFKLIETK